MGKIKRAIIKVKLNSPKVNNKRGAEMVESILMVVISISLVVIVFYPQITGLFTSTMSRLSGWFTTALDEIGPFMAGEI